MLCLAENTNVPFQRYVLVASFCVFLCLPVKRLWFWFDPASQEQAVSIIRLQIGGLYQVMQGHGVDQNCELST